MLNLWERGGRDLFLPGLDPAALGDEGRYTTRPMQPAGPAQLSTRYGPGGVTTQTPGFRGGGGGGDLQGAMKELLRMKLDRAKRAEQDELAARARVDDPLAVGPRPGARARPRPEFNVTAGGLGSSVPGSSGLAQRAQIAALHDLEGKVRAKSAPPPTRTVHGPGIIPGNVMDDMAMNAYQREAYLPQGSGMVPWR